MYIGFLMKFGGHTDKHDLRRVTDWQMADMEMAIWNDKIDYTKVPLETVHNKNRRSGKTKDATRVATFFGLLDKEVKWRSAYMAQQNMAKFWLLMNPFVSKINNLENNVYLYGKTHYPINMGVMTAANCTGVECDVAMFDEGGWVFENLQLYVAYKNARPMVAASKFKHIIHTSTPARYSAFQEAWDDMEIYEKELETKLTTLRTWEDCPWITPEFLEYEERMNSDCPWYVDQNYKGISVVHGGAVFSNFYDIEDSEHVSDELYDLFRAAIPTNGGVDWNGEWTKHYLVLIKVTEKYIFVLEELKFLNIEFLKDYHNTVSLELEDLDPFSTQFADKAKRMGLKCQYFGWDMAYKMGRVQRVKDRTVIIDKRKCPTTWKNFKDAGYDQKARLPELEKRSDQHGLDCVLHGVHETPSGIHYKKISRAPVYAGGSVFGSGWNH